MGTDEALDLTACYPNPHARRCRPEPEQPEDRATIVDLPPPDRPSTSTRAGFSGAGNSARTRAVSSTSSRASHELELGFI